MTYAGRTNDALRALEGLGDVFAERASPTLAAYYCYARGEAVMQRDPAGAAVLFERGLTLAASVDNRMLLGVTAVSVASLRARHGSLEEALPAFGAVIDHLHRGGDWTHLWVGLRSLVELFVRAGADHAAAVLLGAVTGAPTAPPVYGADAERLSAVGRVLQERLGSAGVVAARASAGAMVDDQVVAFARRGIDGLRASLNAT